MRATYDPADDKIRIYSDTRLDPETYQRVKTTGFGWAPKQLCFFAVWRPDREDLATELAGDLEDEDTTLADRAEVRADRFEGYQEKRAAEADHTADAVSQLADGIPLGQPILVGHHSEKRARKDAERIRSGMEKTVKLWKTSKYWEQRAAGVLRNAAYKEQPDVRARRIKGLEADERKYTRVKEKAERFLTKWRNIDDPACSIRHRDGSPATLRERATFLANYDHTGMWGDLTRGILTPEAACERATTHHTAAIAECDRWLEHLGNRLTYERALLAESGYTPPPKPKTKGSLPLLNVRGKVTYRNSYRRDEPIETDTVDITKAELAKISNDYKGTRVSADGTFRMRYICRRDEKYVDQIVFVTDSKEHKVPTMGTTPALPSAADEARVEAERRADTKAEEDIANKRRIALRHRPILDLEVEMSTELPDGADRLPPGEYVARVEKVTAIAKSLEAGVQAVAAPSLFETPPELARRMVYLADPCGLAGKRVLEPSAGTGNLVRAIQNSATGADNVRVAAIEINQKLIEGLGLLRQRVLYANEDNFQIDWGDFLDARPEGPFALGYFHAVIMNPPFNHGDDIKHVQHALKFLKPGGVLVGICADGPRQNVVLKPQVESWEKLPPGTFKGTGVNAALFVIRR
jgi:SAM-dependent methyltransferase